MQDVLEQGSEERRVQETLRRIKRRFIGAELVLYDRDMLRVGGARMLDNGSYEYFCVYGCTVAYWGYPGAEQYYSVSPPRHMMPGDTLTLHVQIPLP